MAGEQEGSVRERNLLWNNEDGPYHGPVEPRYDVHADPEFEPGDPSFRLSPGSLAVDTGGPADLLPLPDLGWLEFEYPPSPRVSVAILSVPDTLAPGAAIDGLVRVTNRSDASLRVDLSAAAAGRLTASIPIPSLPSVPPMQSMSVPVTYELPGTIRIPTGIVLAAPST